MKLCNPRTGIITKENAKRPVFGANEKLWLNAKYNSPNIRFSFIPTKTPLQLVQSGSVAKRIEQTEDSVRQERSMIIDANVVRIMKARRVMLIQNLLKEVMTQITLFKAQPGDIKKRIESLIEREYLTTDPNDKNCCIYRP